MKLKSFSEHLFRVCPILNVLISNIDLYSAISHFQNYKSVIPVRGAIILNKKMTKVLMVKGWKSNATWGFPRGKINKDEPDDLCAIREVYEEIGYDISPYLNPNDFIDITVRQKNFKLYIVHGVPGSTKFCPQTRKEISKIEWHDVNTLPAFSSQASGSNAAKQYFLVAPFMSQLAKYITKKKGLPVHITQSEAAALKNLLGVSSNGSNSGTNGMVNKDAAAAELLNILKSGNSHSGPSTDQNVLFGMLNGSVPNEVSATPSSGGTTEIEDAKELLSLLQTQIDRHDEEASLQNVSSNQATSLSAPQNQVAHGPAGGSEGQYPTQMLPPQPAPVGYMMPPNMPIPVMPYPPPLPGSMIMPYPMFAYPVPPANMAPGMSMPNPFISPVQHQNPSNGSSTQPSENPPVPHDQSQPYKALLALLEKSKTKKQTQISATTAPVHNPAPPPGSSSKALLSLLQKPKPRPPTPPPIVPELLSSNDQNEPDGSALLNLLKPQNSLQPTNSDSQESSKPDQNSLDLLNMIKGNSNSGFKPSYEPSTNSDSSLLLSMLRPTAPTSTTEIPTSITTGPATERNDINIRDEFSGQTPKAPIDPVSNITQGTHILTVSDLESGNTNGSSPEEFNSRPEISNSSSYGIPGSIGSGKDLLNFLHGGLQVNSNTESSILPHNIPSHPFSTTSESQPPSTQPALLKAMFASVGDAGNVSSSGFSSFPTSSEPNSLFNNVDSSIITSSAPNSVPNVVTSTTSGVSSIATDNTNSPSKAGNALLSLLRGNVGKPSPTPITTTMPALEKYPRAELEMPPVPGPVVSDSPNVEIPAFPESETNDDTLLTPSSVVSETPNIEMPPVPGPDNEAGREALEDPFANNNQPAGFAGREAGKQILAQLFGGGNNTNAVLPEEPEEWSPADMVDPLERNSVVVAGTDSMEPRIPLTAGETDGSLYATDNSLDNVGGQVQMPEMPIEAQYTSEQVEKQQEQKNNQDQSKDLLDFLRDYSAGSFS